MLAGSPPRLQAPASGYESGMIRVGDHGSPDPGQMLGAQPAAPVPRADGVRPAFAQAFEASSAGHQQQELEELIGKVDGQARMLLKSPTPGNVAAYREAVRRFLKQVSEKIGRTDKRTDRRNRTLVVLRELDQKLANLTEALLKGQLGPIELAASVDEIRGLLLDLLI